MGLVKLGRSPCPHTEAGLKLNSAHVDPHQDQIGTAGWSLSEHGSSQANRPNSGKCSLIKMKALDDNIYNMIQKTSCLEINLTKCEQDLHTENYVILL